MSFQEPGTYRSGLALGKSGGSLDVGPVIRSWGQNEEFESPGDDPIPCSVWVVRV